MDSPASTRTSRIYSPGSSVPAERHLTYRIVSIEGNIGSGKTTLLTNLRKVIGDNKNIVFLKEPVDEWDTIRDSAGNTMLQKFYADQDKYSFPFQMMAYISRLHLLRSTIRQNPDAIIITERSLYTDKMVFAKMLFETGKIEDVNYQIYLRWFDSFVEECPVEQIVYVKADPNICHERIAKRSRAGESNIPLNYLEECHRYHESMLDRSSPDCACHEQLLLDGNVDIYESEDALKKMIEDVIAFIMPQSLSGDDDVTIIKPLCLENLLAAAAGAASVEEVA